MNYPKIQFNIEEYLIYQRTSTKEIVAIEKTDENTSRINELNQNFGELRNVPSNELIDVILTSFDENKMIYSLTTSIVNVKICDLWEQIIISQTSLEELLKIFKK